MVDGVGPVVVGTDFSDTAASALHEGRRLAVLLGARLEVVHVADGSAGPVWQLPPAGSEWLGQGGVEPDQLVVRFGSGWVELARYAADASPSLMVVGSHGRSGYQPLTLGSTAARLSLQACCPVVIVSPRVPLVTVEAGMQDRITENVLRAGAVTGARAGQQITDEG
jgi:nucleotide-binding universal stress UspA family protein